MSHLLTGSSPSTPPKPLGRKKRADSPTPVRPPPIITSPLKYHHSPAANGVAASDLLHGTTLEEVATPTSSEDELDPHVKPIELYKMALIAVTDLRDEYPEV